MDKKKQIEEMTKELKEIQPFFYGSLAEHLIEQGYRKIPEGAVVLTREEYEKLNMLAEECIKWRSKYCNTNEICKEFTEGKDAKTNIINDDTSQKRNYSRL